jgi:thioesterase domain-containing protein/acyl carrier protein
MTSPTMPASEKLWEESALRELLYGLLAATLRVDIAEINPDKNFDEYGLDSIDAVIATESIGRRLDLELPPEFLFENRSINAVVQALLNDGRTGPSEHTVFLFPGGGGYEGPGLARFRAKCAPRITCDLIRLGDWQDWIRHGRDIDELAKCACQYIESRAVNGSLRIAGYSQGGQLAFATALALERAGRSVRFVGLLDSGAARPPNKRKPVYQRRVSGPVRDYLALIGGRKTDANRDARQRILSWLWDLPWLWDLRHGPHLFVLIARLGRPMLGARGRVTLNRFIQMRLFSKMWNEWVTKDAGFKQLNAPVFLFRAEYLGQFDLGWRSYCSNLKIVPIAGDHSSMFESEHLEGLIEKFANAVH